MGSWPRLDIRVMRRSALSANVIPLDPKEAHNLHTYALEIKFHRDLRVVLLIRRLSDYRSFRRGGDRARSLSAVSEAPPLGPR